MSPNPEHTNDLGDRLHVWTRRTDRPAVDSVTDPAGGDDIQGARVFCLQSRQDLDAVAVARMGGHRDADTLVERLTRIQRDAKRTRARSIYRSAQTVLALLQNPTAHRYGAPDWMRIDARIAVLSRLLDQYETGLGEVEAQLDDTLAPTGTGPAPTSRLDAEIVKPHRNASETLDSLLPHASEAERAALSRLMSIDPVPASTSASSAMESPAPQLPPDAESVDATSDPEDLEALETLMPSMVQRLLEVAHQFGKVLSVSHSVDHVRVPTDKLPGIERHLYESLSPRIASDLPLQGVGHIDIAASRGPDGDTRLQLSGTGFESFTLSLSELCADTSTEIEPSEPRVTPMITDAVEAELRAQLALLLDGGL